jgi:hypothetical protein
MPSRPWCWLDNLAGRIDASLPFSGYKQSGWGREMGHEVLEAYTEAKAVTTQLQALHRRDHFSGAHAIAARSCYAANFSSIGTRADK